MAYVPVPKDLNAVKTKVLLNLTKRQLVCFGAGAALGVPLFFLLKAHTGVSTAAVVAASMLTDTVTPGAGRAAGGKSGAYSSASPYTSPRSASSE